MDLTSDFHSYHERVTKSLVDIVKTGGQISNADLSFHRSNEKVSRALDQQNVRLLRLTNKLLKAASQESSAKPATLRDQDGIEDNWRGIVDVLDDLLEKADASLDEFTGAINRLSPAQQDGAQTPSKQPPQPVKPAYRAQFAKVMFKPQMLFHKKINNLAPEPFKPLLVSKPHAIIPLEKSVGGDSEECGHPYAEEITQYQYPQRVHESIPPIPFTPPEETSAIFVDTEQSVQDMLQELKTAQEIAVDLEHHEYRSYYGIVSLMQISTRDKDWIVDTLKPWRENLQVLNEVFANPQIVKVFHGSSMDMIWLQRDLGLYVVGLFDTYYACEALQFPGKGLKYLLSRFVNFEAQKQYQLADWRIRPLPAELIDYARSDTHYLLYIYDILRNMLVAQSTPRSNLINHVLEGSKKEAIQVYGRFVYDKESGRGSHGWYNLFTEHSNQFTPAQFAVFRALHEWRDKQAREDDEGISYICPNKVLWMLAESMPTNQTLLYGSGIRPIPASILKNTSKIFEIVRSAKQEAIIDPAIHEFLRLNNEKYGVPHNRWRKFKEDKPKSQYNGVGATLQQLTQFGDVASAVSTPKPELDYSRPATPVVDRAEQSALWGSITTTIPGISIETQAALVALQSVLPLPTLSGETFADMNGAESATPARFVSSIDSSATAQPSPQAVTPSQAASRTDDIFTLKQQSRKRKADDVDSVNGGTESLSISTTRQYNAGSPTSAETPSDNTSINTLTPEHAANRRNKQQRKAEKRARKAAIETQRAAQATNMVPFDYTSAPSLLDSSPASASAGGLNGSAKGKRKGEVQKKGTVMNPFAKALDTGTGAKRNKLGQEGSGRSMTFQS